MCGITQTDRQLVDIGERLVHEFDYVPAGLVLRCVARRTQVLQFAGIGPARLAPTVEESARQWLSDRYAAA